MLVVVARISLRAFVLGFSTGYCKHHAVSGYAFAFPVIHVNIYNFASPDRKFSDTSRGVVCTHSAGQRQGCVDAAKRRYIG